MQEIKHNLITNLSILRNPQCGVQGPVSYSLSYSESEYFKKCVQLDKEIEDLKVEIEKVKAYQNEGEGITLNGSERERLKELQLKYE